MSNNSNTVYLSTNPEYPTFVKDSSIALNLCYYHDVATCLNLDKSDGKLAPFSHAAWRYVAQNLTNVYLILRIVLINFYFFLDTHMLQQ